MPKPQLAQATPQTDDGPTRYTAWQYLRAGLYFNLYGLVKYLPSPVGDKLRGLVLKLFARRIASSRIRDGVTVCFPEGLELGRNVSLNEHVHIIAFGGVSIGDNCRIAHQCSIISENHGFDRVDVPIYRQAKTPAKVVIEDDVWLGAGVRVLAGVTIGRGSVVGAGAVVTRDLPAFSIAVGVPAKVVGRRGRGDAAGIADVDEYERRRDAPGMERAA